MTAQCVDCRTLYTWKARRGSKLADLRCTCGGELESTTWQFDSAPAGDGTYLQRTVYRGRRTGALGHWPNDADGV